MFEVLGQPAYAKIHRQLWIKWISREAFTKKLNIFEQCRIGITVLGIKNCIGQHRQPMADAGPTFWAGAGGRDRVYLHPKIPKTRVFLHCQMFNPRIFEHLDGDVLEHAEIIRQQRFGPLFVSQHVRKDRQIAVQAGHAVFILVNIGDVQALCV